MSVQENKALLRRDYEELWSQGNLDLIDQDVAPDYVHHDPATPGRDTEGIEGYKQLVIL